MAKIPDYTSLSRAVPQVSGDIDTRGIGANIGQGLMDVAQVSSDAYQRKTDLQMAKAKADFSIGLIAEESALDQDPDFSTYDQRFNENIQKRIDKAAEMITDGAARNEFMNAISVPLAATADKVRGKAMAKETDFERGELMTTLTTAKDAAITSGNVDGFFTVGKNYIDASVQAGHVSAEEAARMKESYQTDLSEGYLSTLEPEQRLKVMGDIKKHLPADKYIALEKKAKEELMIGKAQAQVDEYLNAGMDRKEAMSDIKKKYNKDPELRKEVESRFEYNFSKQQTAIIEDQSELFDKYFLPIRAGEQMVDDIPREDLERMSPAQQNSLFAAQKTSVSSENIPFNVAAEDELNILIKTKNPREARKRFIELAGSMSDSQNKAWSKVTVDGVIPPDVKALFAASASIDAKVPKYTPERKAVLKDAMNAWFQDYQEKTGQIPTDDLIDKQTNRMIMEHDTSWWFGGNKPVFEMSPKDKEKSLKVAKDDDPTSFADAEEYFKRIGKQPDHAQFLEAYQLLREKRSAE